MERRAQETTNRSKGQPWPLELSTMLLSPLLRPEAVLLDLQSRDRSSALLEISDVLASIDKKRVVTALRNREKLQSTGMGGGVGPEPSGAYYLRLLAGISRLLRRDEFRTKLFAARTSEQVIAEIKRNEQVPAPLVSFA